MKEDNNRGIAVLWKSGGYLYLYGAESVVKNHEKDLVFLKGKEVVGIVRDKDDVKAIVKCGEFNYKDECRNEAIGNKELLRKIKKGEKITKEDIGSQEGLKPTI